ncbi:CPBP family glutamic-type intramembrane protease [Parafannyhessea umbonata]|uniref:CPBP family glutamic-type intramembrane protease n=1 Tax=Parafannyhessea umbonata TaxID=604330 RepID=UPI00359C61BC
MASRKASAQSPPWGPSFFAACLATGAIWGLWHLPLWFTQGAGRETAPFPAFVALAVLLSFWLSALYRAGGCAFSCRLLHALANTLGAGAFSYTEFGRCRRTGMGHFAFQVCNVTERE